MPASPQIRSLPPPPAAAFFQEPGEPAVLDALRHPPHTFLEWLPEGKNSLADMPFLKTADAWFIFSTLTCYRQPVAEWLTNALRDHYGFGDFSAISIRTALHEAISNAVLHGSLAMRERPQDLAALGDYHEYIRMRLLEPHVAHRRVGISVALAERRLILSVHDEGIGYASYAGAGAHGGLGLCVIRAHARSLRFLRQGATLEMDFTIA